MLKGKFTLEDLNDKQREILSGLFPEHRPRGYQKIKGGIIPNRFMKQQS